jgi:GGDEF domain-containing protein
MSIAVARTKRIWLYVSIFALLLMVAAVSAVSARDPDGMGLRLGMILMTVGATMWLSWQVVIPMTLLFWLGPNSIRASITDDVIFNTNALLELPGLIGLAIATAFVRYNLRRLEDEDLMIGAGSDDLAGVNKLSGIYEEHLLLPALEGELLRARRFGRNFALVLVGVDELHQRFDYRNPDEWQRAFTATAQLLRGTRVHIDRVYHYGPDGFAMLLPESGEADVRGLVRRLSRLAKNSTPAEGEPGGPLPVHFGATFFPDCATTIEGLIQRAEIALILAEKSPTRLQIDGAEAPDPPPPETFRRGNEAPSAPQPVPANESYAAADAGAEPEPAPLSASIAEQPRSEGAAPAPPSAPAAIDVPAAAPAAVVESAPPTPIRSEPPRPAQAVAVPATQPAAAPESVEDILRRLDETLGMIKTLKDEAGVDRSRSDPHASSSMAA